MIITVNATAVKFGGALSVLQHFIDYINFYDKDNKYIIFCGAGLKIKAENIIQVNIITNGWSERIMWDNWGFNKYLIKNRIVPSKIISFQNTGARTVFNVPQILYYHQPLPLYSKRWSIFKKRERLLFAYKHLYPVFVKWSLKYVDKVFIQQHFLKQRFATKYRYSLDKIIVESIDIPLIHATSNNVNKSSDELFHIIFPASSLVYKNHIEIVQAIFKIKAKNIEQFKRIKVHFIGVTKDKMLPFVQEVINNNIDSSFIFEGTVPYEHMQEKYQHSDMLVFPSYIETLGLPLIEAAMNGLPILAADEDYAKEALNGYSNVTYLPVKNPDKWADAILQQMQHPTKGKDFLQMNPTRPAWEYFFEEIKK
jgi:glycosyltransferase involved in cell wall biosynthesis